MAFKFFSKESVTNDIIEVLKQDQSGALSVDTIISTLGSYYNFSTIMSGIDRLESKHYISHNDDSVMLRQDRNDIAKQEATKMMESLEGVIKF